jgi:CheY-like chemotaxis protein
MLQRLIGEDVEMVTALDADPATIFADPGQIEQVLMNLAVNARDAMPGGGRLTVATANVEISGGKAGDSASGAYVRLSVRDTGHGMDRKTQARIFEPFFTTKEVGKGTGLGLSTVYGIVQQSGGFLDLESEVGSGATFLVYLPHAREDLSESAPPDREVRSSRGGGETILLVEDDAALRALATRLLERFGYRTLVAPNGQEALRTSRAHEGAIDLLLTDVVMPGMSGRDLADRLTGERTRMRVLFVSGYTDDTILHHGVLQTGIQLLPKPYTPDVLAQKLREVLEA